MAVKDGQASDVTEKELSFIQIPEVQEKGIKVYEASGMITSKTNKPYEGKIRITVVNGKIAKIVDNGTVPVALQDEVCLLYTSLQLTKEKMLYLKTRILLTMN